MDENDPIFAISVAAVLASMHPQTLRQYDRLGLVSPKRTAGKSRRYTMRNVVQLREIARLGAEGVSLEGIRRILQLENQVSELAARVQELEQEAKQHSDQWYWGEGGFLIESSCSCQVFRNLCKLATASVSTLV